MIVEMAYAHHGFLSMKDTNTISGDDFYSCLKNIFSFKDVDIKEFDGNTCQIGNLEDPTNSIFFFNSKEYRLCLYTITNATPRVFKNQLIWDCQCYMMESMSKVNKCIEFRSSAQALIYKNIMPYGKENLATSYDKNIYRVSIKDNFKTAETYKQNFGNTGMLKIKCLVNPTTQNLTSNAPDGSYNFYFPIKFYQTSSFKESQIELITNSITNGINTLSIQEVISKYSENIKSIEYLPFYPSDLNSMDGAFSSLTSTSNIVSFNLIGSAVWTDCGVFINNDHYKKFDHGIFTSEIPVYQIPTQLAMGGGARGFLRTPIGNIELDFNAKGVYNLMYDPSDPTAQDGFEVTNAFYVLMKEEGWKIDGQFTCEVPPLYINFYTDNAGQVFIQNMTTNAQELRQMEREKVLKETKIASDYAYSQLEAGASGIGALLSGNLLGGILGTVGNVAKNQVQYEKNLSEYRAEYNVSKAQYDDKIRTQSLLASMTGKQLSGNISLLDFSTKMNSSFYELNIEFNYVFQRSSGVPGTDREYDYFYILQPDYDYSVEISTPCGSLSSLGNVNLNSSKILLVNENNGTPTLKYARDEKTFLSQIFGYTSYYEDKIGCPYQISFRIQNTIITGTEEDHGYEKYNSTKILNFYVSRKRKKQTIPQ